MKKLGVGVIGCGRHALRAHLPFYFNNPYVDIVAVCSRTETHAKETAKKFRARSWYTDYRQLLERDDIQAVSICTPVWLHKEIAIYAATRGKHILCEKPLALNSQEAKDMLVRAEKYGVILMPAFCHRFYPPNERIKQLIEKKYLGRIVTFRNRFADKQNYESSWFVQKDKAGGGVIIDNCIHSVDIFRWLIGEIESVFAYVSTFGQNIKVEDTVIIGLKGKDNALLGIIESSWVTFIPSFRIEVYGTEGTAISDYNCNELRYKRRGYSSWVVEKNRYSYEKVFELLINHFINCILNKESPKIKAADGLISLQIIESVYKSIEEARSIRIQ